MKTKSRRRRLKPGDTVRLTRRVQRTGKRERATVRRLLSPDIGIEGGVFLETPLDGFRYWNVADLEACAPR